MISHAEAQALTSARLDGQLDPVAERELVAHLSTCPTCRAFAEQSNALAAGLRELPYLPASPTVSKAVHAYIAKPRTPWARLNNLMPLQAMPAFSAVAAALIVVVLGVFIYLRTDKTGTPLDTDEDPPPVSNVNELLEAPSETVTFTVTETPAEGDPAQTRGETEPTSTVPTSGRATDQAAESGVTATTEVQTTDSSSEGQPAEGPDSTEPAQGFAPTAEPTTAAETQPSVTSDNSQLEGAADETEVPATEVVVPSPTDTPAEPTETPVPPTSEPTQTPESPTSEPTSTAPDVEQTETPETALFIQGTSETPVPPTQTLEPTETPVPPTQTPEPTETPVPPTQTPEPTETPVPPTQTPEPTETPVPPTQTPEPTETPEPTDEPTQTLEPTLTEVPTEEPTETPVPTETWEPTETSEPTAEPTDETPLIEPIDGTAEPSDLEAQETPTETADSDQFAIEATATAEPTETPEVVPTETPSEGLIVPSDGEPEDTEETTGEPTEEIFEGGDNQIIDPTEENGEGGDQGEETPDPELGDSSPEDSDAEPTVDATGQGGDTQLPDEGVQGDEIDLGSVSLSDQFNEVSGDPFDRLALDSNDQLTLASNPDGISTTRSDGFYLDQTDSEAGTFVAVCNANGDCRSSEELDSGRIEAVLHTPIGWIGDTVIYEQIAGETVSFRAFDVDPNSMELSGDEELISGGREIESTQNGAYEGLGGILIPGVDQWVYLSLNGDSQVLGSNPFGSIEMVRTGHPNGQITYIGDGQLVVADISDPGTPLSSLGVNPVDYDLAPGGDMLVISIGNAVQVIDLEGNVLESYVSTDGTQVGSVLWLNQGIAYVDQSSGGIRLIPLEELP